MKKELAVITHMKDLCNYIFVITDKSPKKFRLTLVSRMQNMSLDIMENLLRANAVYVRNGEDISRIQRRQGYQREGFVSLKMLGYLVLLAREQQCILPKQYEQISIQAEQVNRLLVAWARSDQKRYKGCD